MRTLRRALAFTAPYWRIHLLAFALALIGTLLDLVQPWLSKVLLDDVFVSRSMAALRFVSLAWLVAMLGTAVANLARSYVFTWLGERTLVDLRNRVFAHMQTLPLAHFADQQTGRLLSVFTNDVGAMQMLYTSMLADTVTNALRFAVVFVAMFRMNAGLAWRAMPVMPLFGLSVYLFGEPLRRIGHLVQEQAAEVSAKVQEAIAGVRETKSFTQEERQQATFRVIFHAVLERRLKQTLLGGWSGLTTHIAAWGGMLWVIWSGGCMVIDGKLTPGTLIAFISLLGSLFGPTAFFVSLNVSLQGALAGADRVLAFLAIEPAVADAPDAMALGDVTGRVRLDEVSFAYGEGEPVLRDISLEAEPGEVIALVGPSGAGKSTLVHLLARFHDPTAGQITLDGHDLRGVTQASLRRHVGTVFQDTFLFDGTVEDNLRFGRPDATTDEVIAAARAANAHEFIEALPEGYQTRVGERGAKLSGGQRQRLSIGRALLRDPRVLILDEATSALDTESEALIQDALTRLEAGRTTFIIAHRLSTIQSASRIAVLDGGRLAEIGTHAELLARNGVYRRLHEAQALGAA